MNLTAAIKTVLRKYVDFNGRARRPEFWYWMLSVVLLSVVLAIIEGALLAPALGFEPFAPESGQPLRLVMSLLIFLPTLAVAVRRLHDIGRSGWWILIQIVPIIGSLLLLWWYAQPSDPEPNNYG
ncbi:DUF805 domain-containing protein [Congregibacter litoralis]|uniref:Putative membrane protein n=1 Tax=Congregibacter litoralis KT71 TaxID=314285 RepID=A4A4U3_9GAMM|nr:DUF805 domain-containing protein [Congregibacter litoralis]EAQ98814.2 putative membrane protein [Congregibacter litoralis KT71]